MNYDPSYKTAHLFQYGNPALFHNLVPATGAVMQDHVLTSNQRYFVSQAGTASDPSTPYEDTIITRYNPSTGNSDSMRLIDAGHGIGIDVEYADGKTYIIMTWRGKTADSGWRENDLVRFPYAVGTFSYGTVKNEFGMKVIPINWPELLVHVDWKNGWTVAKHYDSAGNDIYQRRQWYDMRDGVDKVFNTITLPISTGTLQGFTTINDTLYRYMGTAGVNNAVNPNDPIAIEEFDWNTGAQIAYHTYPDIGKVNGVWPDGRAEPEGISVYREANGKASLLVGLTLGNAGANRRWKTYKFGEIGL